VVAIVRSNQVVFPRGDSTLAEGDEVLALVTTESESEVTKLLVSPEAEPDLPSGSGSVRDSAG
jgi:Trk K+ transport system NAD-binding subunit